MINMPIIKFEKSVNYLTNQLEVQENNKQLLLDITANLQLMSNSYANDKNLSDLLNNANNLLQDISTNITTIEKSELEISNITNELSNLLNNKNRTSKTKEYYIIAFSNIKNSIVSYTNSFLELQKKLENDNNNLNEFININNFKYNFTEVLNKQKIDNDYKYTGFSVNNEETNTNYETDVESDTENNSVETDIKSNIESANLETVLDIDNNEIELSDEVNTPNQSDSNETDINDLSLTSIEDIFLLEDLSNDIDLENSTTNNTLSDDIEEIDNIEDEPSIIDTQISSSNTENNIKENANEISIEDIFELEDFANEVNSQDNSQNAKTVEEDDISLDDLLNDISEEDISLDDLSDDILEENNTTQKTDIHYSYTELKDELNKIFNEINGFIEETNDDAKQDQNKEQSELNDDLLVDDIDVLDDLVLEDIDLSVLDNNTQNSDSNISEYSLEENTEDTIETTNNSESNDDINEIVNDISDSSFVDNNLRFKEKLSNNNFSLIEEEIFDEYSSFELPVKSNIIIENTEEIPSNKDFNVIEDIDTEQIIEIEDNVDSLNLDTQDEIILEEPDIVETTVDSTNQNNEINSETDIEEKDIAEDNTINDIIDVEISDKNIFEDLNSSDNNKQVKNTDNNSEFEEKIKQILSATENNNDLIISERTRKIYLPYTIDELIEFIENYPDVYSSLSDVVLQEFVLSFDYFITHPVKARFEEAYNLIKNREHNTSFEAFKIAIKVSKMNNLNPAIIAACKNEYDLNNYIYHLNSNSLNKFKSFKIYYDITPL